LKILLTGRNGQVGSELERLLPQFGEITAIDRAEIDLADADAVRRAVRDVKPQLIVNPAAYTAVDKAESEPQLALKVNAVAPAVLAEEAKRLGAKLVHYSTDYVFDGNKSSPYVEGDAADPLSVYGRTKLEGERAVLGAGARAVVLRTSWVYSLEHESFIAKMIKAAKARRALRVVDDQVGTPTSARLVAEATLAALELDGLFHVAGVGAVSRFEFVRTALALSGMECDVQPCASSEFPVPARRPAYSALSSDKFTRASGMRLPTWHADLTARLRTELHKIGASG